jgi:hypothetical protein
MSRTFTTLLQYHRLERRWQLDRIAAKMRVHQRDPGNGLRKSPDGAHDEEKSEGSLWQEKAAKTELIPPHHGA